MIYRYDTKIQKIFKYKNMPTEINKKIFLNLENKNIWKIKFTNDILPLINKEIILVCPIGILNINGNKIGCNKCYILALENKCKINLCNIHKKENENKKNLIEMDFKRFIYLQKNIKLFNLIYTNLINYLNIKDVEELKKIIYKKRYEESLNLEIKRFKF